MVTRNPNGGILIFGREPVLILGTVYATVALVSALIFPLTDEQQGVLNTVAAAVIALLEAAFVGREKLAAMVLGLLRTLIAAGVAFGLHWDPNTQGAVMVFATAVLSAYARTQVVAPVPASNAR